MPWKVFLSFEEEDRGTVAVFREHVMNEDFDLELSYYGVKEPFDGVNAPEIQSDIIELLEEVSILLVLIGRTTYADKWVDWEIRTAAGMGKGILGMRLHSELEHIIPRALKDYGAEIHDPHTREVLEAIEREALGASQ